MQPRTPGLHNLTVDVLQECASDLEARGLTSATSLALAHTILINTFGGDFWVRNLTKAASKLPILKDKPHSGAIHLAHMLWLLRDCEGFSDFLDRNRDLDLESAYYELFAARMLLKASSAVKFVRPVSQRGRDFDLLAYDFLGRYHEFSVEVKARRKALASARSMRSFLAKHRSQLPQSGPGGLFCKLEGVADGPPADHTFAEVSHWLRGTGRVDYVFLCWDASPDAARIELRYEVIDAQGRAGPILGTTPYAPTVPSYIASLGLASMEDRA
jgi:hypothetical protein